MNNQIIKQLVKPIQDLKIKNKSLKSEIIKSQTNLEKTTESITQPPS